MRAVGYFLNLQTDFRVRFDELRLHSLSRKEIEFLAVVSVMHRHHVRPAIARATEVAKALPLQQRVHFRRRHVFNFQHSVSP